MGTKTEPGAHDCYTAAEDDEPMFVLLARDPYAPALVDDWADEREHRGREGDREKADDARHVAAEMRAWRAEHPR